MRAVQDAEFRALFTDLREVIYSFAARRLSPDEAKDVVGETFEVVWRKRAQAPLDPDVWPAWVIGIARNKVLQEEQRSFRKHHDHRFAADWAGQAQVATPDMVAGSVVDSLLGRRVYARLTPAERELFDLAHIRELTPRSASEILGISVTAYTSRVSRLRKRIVSLYEEESDLGEAPGSRDTALEREP